MGHERATVFSFSDLEQQGSELLDLSSGDRPEKITKVKPKVKRSPAPVEKPIEYKSYLSKVWRERPLTAAVHEGLLEQDMEPAVAEIFARRIDNLDTVLASLKPTLADLDSPWLLPDVDTASKALVAAVENKQRIALVCDFDADGMNSAAVLLSALTDYFHVSTDLVDLYIGQRLTEGYGLSDKLVDRILEQDKRPDIIITADCGSSDEARIARLKALDIAVIVTDHHTMPLEGYPKSSLACVTPLRDDSDYPDPKIAGCMVAWLLMSALRHHFIESKRIPASAPSLKLLLDFVALATVADCVSLGDSKNNRAVVNYGLKLINKDSRPCWRAFRDYIGGHDVEITSETLAFGIAPRLNARGRLSDAMTGVDFLLADNDVTAANFAALLDSENKARKEVEKAMCLVAIERAKQLVGKNKDGLVVYLEDGHPGVHGIVASRVTEKTGKPSVMLSPMVGNVDPDGDKVLSGSCRSVDGVDVKQALLYVAEKSPEIFIKFGGHAGAAGLTTKLSKLKELEALFDEAVKVQAGQSTLVPVLETDGVIQSKDISLDFIDNIMRAAPFGRGFMYPVYEGDYRIESMRPVGDKTHLSLSLTDGKYTFKAIWFNVRETADDPLPVVEGAGYRFAFNISENVYKGSSSVQLMVMDAMDRGLRK